MTDSTIVRRRLAWPEFGLAAVLAALAIVVAVAGYRDARRYPNVPVGAEGFVWPDGCRPQAYAHRGAIPKRCARYRNRIDNSTELGLITTGRNTRWYRVGDDALLLACFVLGDDCHVRSAVPGKFIPAPQADLRQAEGRIEPIAKSCVHLEWRTQAPPAPSASASPSR